MHIPIVHDSIVHDSIVHNSIVHYSIVHDLLLGLVHLVIDDIVSIVLLEVGVIEEVAEEQEI